MKKDGCHFKLLRVGLFSRHQDAKNLARNVKMYANKFVVYAKLLKAVQYFVRQYIFSIARLLWP